MDNILHDHICYMKKRGATIILKFYQRNGKLILPH